jgi:hypothetical protein
LQNYDSASCRALQPLGLTVLILAAHRSRCVIFSDGVIDTLGWPITMNENVYQNISALAPKFLLSWPQILLQPLN